MSNPDPSKDYQKILAIELIESVIKHGEPWLKEMENCEHDHGNYWWFSSNPEDGQVKKSENEQCPICCDHLEGLRLGRCPECGKQVTNPEED